MNSASKKMSNHSSCLLILTKLIGFEETNNGEKISLPDEVDTDTLLIFNDYFMEFKDDKNINESSAVNNKNSNESSSYEMKMVENNDNMNDNRFWSCNHCTYNNPLNSTTCLMCSLPRSVCFVTLVVCFLCCL